jgi:spermidine synthase
LTQNTRQLVAVIAIVAGTVLGWEVLLTRMASLRYHFHFGHLAVSNGVLGIGVSGSWLALSRDRWKAHPMAWLQKLVPAFAMSVLLAWMLVYLLPVHRGQMDSTGTTSFFLFVLASLIPFLTGGAVIGLILSGWPKSAAPLYAADLIAGAAVCLLIPLCLPVIGMGGTLAVLLGLACCASAIVGSKKWWFAAGAMMLLSPAIEDHFPAPSKIDRPILHSTWTALSRVDVVAVSDDQRSIRARGIPADPKKIPAQVEIMQDGSASTLLSDFSGTPAALNLFDHALTSGASRLRPEGHMLVIGFGGGDDLWAARSQGVATIDAVDLNAPVLAAHTTVRPQWSAALLNDPHISMIVAEGRNTLMRSTKRYDLVQLTGIDTWTALTSGSYMLAENHLYTTESFGEMLDRLKPDGILQITRMAAEMEALRVLVQLREALSSRSDVAFSRSVVVVGSEDHQMATLVRPDGFSADELNTLAQWAESAQLMVQHLPGTVSSGLISQFVRTEDPTAFVEAFPRNIAPTTDDKPYFFQFTRWTRPSIAAQTIREPTYISQGNPLFLLGQLGWTSLIAGLLLFIPLIRKRGPSLQTTRIFAGLGMGYITLELALMNKLTLFLGHPMRALTVTLAGMLFTSGLGALASSRFQHLRWLWVSIIAMTSVFYLGLPEIMEITLLWPVWARCAAALLLIAPVGFTLGVPFAWFVVRLPAQEVPWAWATNAFFTVVGALMVIIGSMTLGFDATLLCGVALYGVALFRPHPLA